MYCDRRNQLGLPNFRFKTYLKSNLQSLYRDQDGEITWLDKKGNEIDIAAMLQNYPGMVPRIHTKVLHEEQPIKKNSYDAVLANNRLYDYTDGSINENQNQGLYSDSGNHHQDRGGWNRNQGSGSAKLREVLCSAPCGQQG